MILELSLKELEDIKRALIIAMKVLDATGNPQDVSLSNRLELIEKKLK